MLEIFGMHGARLEFNLSSNFKKCEKQNFFILSVQSYYNHLFNHLSGQGFVKSNVFKRHCDINLGVCHKWSTPVYTCTFYNFNTYLKLFSAKVWRPFAWDPVCNQINECVKQKNKVITIE